MSEPQPAESEVIDYERLMMAGLVPAETPSPDLVQDYLDNLHYVMQTVDMVRLKPENQALLQCMEVFRELSEGRGIMDEQALLDILVQERAPAEIQVKYCELYADYAQLQVSPAKFRFVVNRWLEKSEQEDFVKSLNEAFTIKTVGIERHGEKLIGYKAAKEYLAGRLHDLDVRHGTNHVPDGSVREDADSFLIEMEERRNAPATFQGIMSGYGPLDKVTNGVQVGELVIVLGYTEVGKTFFCMNWGHHAATKFGKNVVVATSEVPRKQYSRRIYLRHCRDPRFNLPQGIDSDSFKRGQLTPQEEEGVRHGIQDWKTNPAYGKFDVFQVPQDAELSYIFNKVQAINTRWKAMGSSGVDLFIMDSLNHLTIKNPALVRTIQNERIKQAKHFAVNFDNGRGIPFITPWHANRRSWEEALKKGHYDLNSGEEANELEKSADLFLWLLKLENSKDTHEILAGIEKYRDGAAQDRFTMYEDFASSYMGTVSSGNVVTHSTSVPPVQQAAAGQSGATDPRLGSLF